MHVARILKAVSLGLMFLGAPAFADEPGITDKTVVVGQTLDLSGPVGDLGRDAANGAKAYLQRLNASGGVHGRTVSLVSLDDKFKPELSAANLDRLIRQDKVFAVVSVMGTPAAMEAIRLSESEGVPVFGPAAGAQAIRTPTRKNVFIVRAGFRDEIRQMLAHARTVGKQRVAVVYAEALLSGEMAFLTEEMARNSTKPISVDAVRPDGGGMAELADKVAKGKPEAVMLLTVGKSTVDFIKAYNAVARGPQFYTLSAMGSGPVVQALGTDGLGVIVTSVVPFPWNSGTPIVKEYQEAMRAIGVQEFSFVSLENYINMRVFVEALRRAGKAPTRAKLVAAAESMQPLRLGGFDISYSPTDHGGSHLVELTIIGSGGRFRK